jgi:hypothetical protein
MSRTTGAPGTAQGFGYRIAYIAPELIREALGDRGRRRAGERGDREHRHADVC